MLRGLVCLYLLIVIAAQSLTAMPVSTQCNFNPSHLVHNAQSMPIETPACVCNHGMNDGEMACCRPRKKIFVAHSVNNFSCPDECGNLAGNLLATPAKPA